MSLSPLSRPVSSLMRPTFLLARDQTLGTAAGRLRENSTGMLPVVDGAVLIGVVDERSLASAIAHGAHEIEGIELAFMPESPIIRLYESGAEALRTFEQLGVGSLIVVDDQQRVVGILRASDLIDPPDVGVRPPLVGGMATPFGVYLTSGSVSAGPGNLALISTGALLFTVITLAGILTLPVFDLLVNRGISVKLADPLTGMLTIALFAVGFRLLPIAGVHAAEHMVVHAIERGEPLIPSVVKRMPRVHPRCGTNLATGMSIFLGLSLNPLIPEGPPRVLLALVATVLLWRPVGSLVQYWVTTRPPTDRQIEMGIKSAKMLLERQGQVKVVGVSFPKRIWNSGLFHVLTGSILVASLLMAIEALFPNLPLPK